MTTESANDAFERRYMGRFQELAAEHGVTVNYDRDRAARDIGVHFFRSTRSGEEAATGSLVWFQMKGYQTGTLSKLEFERSATIPVPLKVKDLQLWYRMNGPTYLAVFVESAGKFLVLNIVKYVAEHYGAKILTLNQKTVSVPVSNTSILDAQAFALIIREGTVEEWARTLRVEGNDARLAERDYGLVWRLRTADERMVEHRTDIKDWQSKARCEVDFLERPVTGSDDSWLPIRMHWQFMLNIGGLEDAYPYLSFDAFDERYQGDVEYWSNEDAAPVATFQDGTVVYGQDGAGEYNEFQLRPRLNEMGQRLAEIVDTLVRASMIEVPQEGDIETLDVAPWNARDV